MTERIAPLRGTQRLLILLSLVLLWPALVNGGAFYFPDTTAYIRGPDAMFHHAVGWRSEWTQPATMADRAFSKSPAMQTTLPALHKTSSTKMMLEHSASSAFSSKPGDRKDLKPVLLGRSVFYGVLPFAGMAVGSDWLTILVQALIAGAVVVGLMRHFIDPQRRVFNWASTGVFMLLAATPLPFFISMLMPDFMAGMGVVAGAALMLGWKREARAGRLFWFTIVTAAALMHSANILILLATAIPVFLLALMWHDRGVVRGTALVAAGALLGLIGEVTFAHMVTRVTGAAPIRPPFVTARLIEDGPGIAYLDRTCPRSRFLLCQFRPRMPAGSDTFLWSADPMQGVFKAGPPTIQRALSAEQGRFIVAVATTFPLDVARAAMLAAYRQMSLLSLVEFNYSPDEYRGHLPPSSMRSITSTRAYMGTMPVEMTDTLLWPMVFGSLLTIVAAFFSPKRRLAARYGAVLATGWLANNIICGVLSTPHDRYQARIMWILPFIAFIIIIKMLDERVRLGDYYRTRATSKILKSSQ